MHLPPSPTRNSRQTPLTAPGRPDGSSKFPLRRKRPSVRSGTEREEFSSLCHCIISGMDLKVDLVIIGGGIVGLATALEAARRNRGRRLAVLEKESAIARHQTGHNSGVIHSGIYYKPGSLKAKNCLAGAAAMVGFCREHSIPFDICGKVVVATAESEFPGLHELMRRGTAN